MDDNLKSFDLNTLLEERRQHLETIEKLKAQLVEVGIAPYSPNTPNLCHKRVSLPIYVSDNSDSDALKRHRQFSCRDTNEALKQSVSTYDKRTGTNDLGKQYEYIMCAYYAIRFSLNDNVSDFEMTTNNEIYGDFDDIALKVKYHNGQDHNYLLQLKHTENKKGLSEKILSAEKNDFSLKKYFKTFQNLSEKENLSCILFTNRTAQFTELSQFSMSDSNIAVKPFQDIFYETMLDTNQTSRKSVFQFNILNSDNSELENFLNHFYLFANQNNVSKMKTLITEILKNLLNCDIYDLFLNFMKNWWTGNFILTRSDVLLKLAELALSPFIRTVSNRKTTQNSKILEEAILKFNLTLTIDTGIVSQIWNPFEDIREISLTALKYGLTNKGISHLDQLTPEQRTKALWYLNLVPLIVKIDFGERIITSAIKLLEKLPTKMKLILLGDVSKKHFPNWYVFDSLSDLYEDELYKTIINNFQISLQGKQPIFLKSLIDNPLKSKIIKIKHLVIMTQKALLIGQKKADLPKSYISRKVATTFLDLEKVIFQSLKSNDLLVIINGVKIKNFLKKQNIAYFEQLDFEADSETSIILSSSCTKSQFDAICHKTRRARVHLLKMLDSQSAILVMSSENTLNGDELKCSRDPVPENKIHQIFDNPVNILCAQPGIGKSTMIKFLDKNCRSNFWSVKINLRKFNSLLKKEPEEEEILQHFLGINEADKSFLSEVKRFFLKNHKIFLFLDGLDEIESDCIDFALDYVSYIISTGVHVWISSRQNLEDVITKRFNIFLIDIQELNQTEQLNYIVQRLQTRYRIFEIQRISKEIFQSASLANSHNMLGIPLQLFIITENFLDDVELYNKLSQKIFLFTKMYKSFFDGKKKHLYEKVGVQYEQQLAYNFDNYLENYELPALKSCLDESAYQKLDLDDAKSSDFIKLIKSEGDKFGIVSHINEELAVFTHQTYAEYFACLWLKKNFDKVKLLKDEFKSKKYQNLRLIFDIMLAENSPLHLAVIYLNYDQVETHLSQITSKDEGGRSALHLICSYGKQHKPLKIESNIYNSLFYDENNCSGETHTYRKIFTLLSQTDPFDDDEVYKWNSLQYGVHFQSLYAIEKFLEQWGDKIRLDQIFNSLNNVSLIYYSSKLGYPNLLENTIKRNRNSIHFKIGEAKLSFLHVAVKGDGENPGSEATKIQIIKILVNNGIDINIQDRNGATALHWAISQGCYQMVKTLLDQGADIHCSDQKGESILHYGLQEWEKEVIFFRINTGTYNVLDRDKNGNSILHWASKENNLDVLKKVIHEVDINCRNKLGETPLHFAVRTWKPNSEVVKFLLDNGAQSNAEDSFNVTPLYWVCDRKLYEIISMLNQDEMDMNTCVTQKVILYNNYQPLTPNMKIMEMVIDYGFDVNYKGTNGISILHSVCQKGNLELVKLLISNGSNIKAITKNHETIIHFISKSWNSRIVKLFREIGSDVNCSDMHGVTPLHRAAETGNLEMVQVLLDSNANIHATTKNKETVLLYAIKSESFNLEVISFLISKQVDVNAGDKNGVTALHWAAEKGQYSIVKLLLVEGADINLTTHKKETALHYANSNSRIVKLLLDYHIDVNATDSNGMTVLHYASARSQLDLVKILLSKEADVNAETNQKESILIFAVKQRKINPEIIKLLLHHGADIAAVDQNGMRALHWASDSGHFEVIKLLVEKKVDVDCVTKKKETALHYASSSWQTNIEIIKRLVLAGININCQDEDGATPLHWACKKGHSMNVETLLSLGADFDLLTSSGETCLHFAAKAWKINDYVLEILIEKGVNVNSVDHKGRTALHCASKKGFFDNVKLLIYKGANLNLATKNNLTALHFAVYAGHVRIIKLLIKYGLNISKVQTRNEFMPLYFAEKHGQLREDLLIMMAATIHEKFPLLFLKKYSSQEVITYLQESQPYLETKPKTRNSSTSTTEKQPSFFKSCQNLVADSIDQSVGWFQSVFSFSMCRKRSQEPRSPSFIVHYPVVPCNINRREKVENLVD